MDHCLVGEQMETTLARSRLREFGIIERAPQGPASPEHRLNELTSSSPTVRSSRFIFPELRGHRFRQVFFELRGKPLLQHKPLSCRNQQPA